MLNEMLAAKLRAVQPDNCDIDALFQDADISGHNLFDAFSVLADHPICKVRFVEGNLLVYRVPKVCVSFVLGCDVVLT